MKNSQHNLYLIALGLIVYGAVILQPIPVRSDITEKAKEAVTEAAIAVKQIQEKYEIDTSNIPKQGTIVEIVDYNDILRESRQLRSRVSKLHRLMKEAKDVQVKNAINSEIMSYNVRISSLDAQIVSLRKSVTTRTRSISNRPATNKMSVK